MNLIPGMGWTDIISGEAREKWTMELEFKIHSMNLNIRDILYIDPSDV